MDMIEHISKTNWTRLQIWYTALYGEWQAGAQNFP